MDASGRLAAAHLASRWGWHQLAIGTLIGAGERNALELRFPALYAEDFARAARQQGLGQNWLYAIARQESALNASVKSPAGALGLMQLMPATARWTSLLPGIAYRGSHAETHSLLLRAKTRTRRFIQAEHSLGE